MHLAVVGTECLGVATAAHFADYGHVVECVDTDLERVAQLNSGSLRFSTDLAGAAGRSAAVFLTASTPEGHNGEVDLTPLLNAATAVVPNMRHGSILVVRSAVPVGTGALLDDLVLRRARAGTVIDVVANPEFMRLGSALHDLTHPERVVVGTRHERAAACIRQLFESVYVAETPIIETTIEAAELIKLVADTFLAVKIGYANEIAHLCDRVGADVHVVTTALGLDRRIGLKHLRAGAGIGGPSLLAATRQLAAMGRARGTPQLIAEATTAANVQQLTAFEEVVHNAVANVSSPVISILGLAYKPETSVVTESPAVVLCSRLIARGMALRVFDPCAMSEAKQVLNSDLSHLTYATSPYEAASGADVLVAMTEWEQFRHLDWRKMRRLMRHPAVVDARNMFDASALAAQGFSYWSVGRQAQASRPRELEA
jgi:UDPglucose 6-dehydrogenase